MRSTTTKQSAVDGKRFFSFLLVQKRNKKDLGKRKQPVFRLVFQSSLCSAVMKSSGALMKKISVTLSLSKCYSEVGVDTNPQRYYFIPLIPQNPTNSSPVNIICRSHSSTKATSRNSERNAMYIVPF
jgi:hypothetical protein